MKTTNLELIKQTFKALCLESPFKVVGYGIVQHPFFNSVASHNAEGKITIVDLNNYKAILTQDIFPVLDKATNLTSLFVMVNKPYRLQLLCLVRDFVGELECDELLRWVWVGTESPHQNGIKPLLELFKKTNPFKIMSKEELIVWGNLPEEIVVYRGLQSDKALVRGLSWTLDLEVAKWFANRFKKGVVLSGKVYKKDVFCYFSARNEKELIVNPYKVREIGRILLL
jgi:hypothetical protein